MADSTKPINQNKVPRTGNKAPSQTPSQVQIRYVPPTIEAGGEITE